MDAGAVERIAQLATDQSKVVTIGDRHFSAAKLQQVVAQEQIAKPLVFSTLGGLADYATSSFDDDHTSAPDQRPRAFHVISTDRVDLVSSLLGDCRQREVLASAHLLKRTDWFSRPVSLEAMVIWLQTGFVRTATVDQLLTVVGNAGAENVRNFSDDGRTQVVTARSGVVTKANVVVPTIVKLQPYRTFAEVDQPESPFLLRLQEADSIVTAGLFEADGGAWVSVAIGGIVEWLKERTKDHDIPVFG